MFKPVPLYIGLRYTKAKRRNQFISFISLVSLLGIALGVCVLITVLSVMNGFDQQIRAKIFALAPHITITGISDKLDDWPDLSKNVRQFKGVLNSAPYVTGQGLLTNDDMVHPAIIKGIIPAQEKKISELPDKLITGSIDKLKPGQFGIVLGKGLAQALGVWVGDKVNLMIPQVSVTPIGMLPRSKRFKVVGIFSVGSGFGFDDSYGFIQLNDAQKLFTMGNSVSGIQLKIDDLFNAQKISLNLEKKIGFKYQVSNWTEQYGAFYHAVEMEKTIMFFILLLLVAIAAFNLISSLVMLVNDKQSDIAILRTFGATPRMIMGIFMIQGTIIGLFGTLLGLISGVLLSLYVTQLVNFIQNTFHVQLFTPGVYWVDYLPSQLQSSDVIRVCLIALIMSFFATIYPAWRAARTQPVEALRYE